MVGHFDTAEATARAYDATAVRMHRASATTNFKQPVVVNDHVPATPSGQDAQVPRRVSAI
jgi:hypothetical protein